MFKRLQDMALAPICLTSSVYCIVVPMFVDPPITAPGLSSDDQNQAQIGVGGRGASQRGLVPVS